VNLAPDPALYHNHETDAYHIQPWKRPRSGDNVFAGTLTEGIGVPSFQNGVKLEPGGAMPNLTIKGVPERLYLRLKERAERNRRSLNAEIIVALEEATGLRSESREEVIRRIRERHESMAPVDHSKTQVYKEWGRE
jgi:antitoxin FitA